MLSAHICEWVLVICFLKDALYQQYMEMDAQQRAIKIVKRPMDIDVKYSHPRNIFISINST